MTPLVSISSLHKSYGATPVLRGVDLTIEPGTIAAVLGPSGSGKTTLLRLLAGFERADQGRIEIDGRTVDDARRAEAPEKRRIGYVPQDGALFPHLTVRANIGFGLARARRRSGRVEELLELTGLSAMAERYPHQLSGGQQQRVALARALAPSPDLVLLDEPFSALDAALRASVRTEVIGILRATACTAILVTHDQDEALSAADRIAVLREGRVVQCGTAQELYDSPADAQVARFIGEANLVPAAFTPQGIDAGPLGPLDARGDTPENGVAIALIRPEQLNVHVANPDDADGTRGIVERCDYFGHDMMLTIRTHAAPRAAAGQPLPETLLARLPAGPPVNVGTTVRLTVRGPVTTWAQPA
ncbi:ABC transporter ATP-binding protein [Actinospica sp.]|uniref:ABC transporter ATP-binding protein n=1 Tax=Actinospica sp. TaxID=1872142 RepID=UPI0032C2494B